MPAREFVIPEEVTHQAPSTLQQMVERYRLAARICRASGAHVLLDACCATGWGTRNLATHEDSFVVGFDISNDALSRCNRPGPHCAFVRASGVSIPLKTASFDGIFAFECIEHFPPADTQQFVLELRRLCAPTGWVVGSTPICPTRGMQSMFKEWNPYHLAPFVKHELVSLLTKSFELVEVLELYNFVEPYMVFVCSPTQEASRVYAQTVEAVKAPHLVQEDAKAYSYCRWMLLALTSCRLRTACRLLWDALRWDGSRSVIWMLKIITQKIFYRDRFRIRQALIH